MPPDLAIGGVSQDLWSQILRLQTAAPDQPTLSVVAQPLTLRPEGKQMLVETHLAEAWAEFSRLGFEGWRREDDLALHCLLQRAAEGSNGQPLNLAKLKGLLGEGGVLGAHDARGVHVRYNLLRGLSSLVTADVLPFIDLRKLQASRHGKLLLACRHYMLPELRDAGLREALERGGASAGEEALHLDRSVALECRDSGCCDSAGDVMVFAQAARQAAEWPNKVLRSKAPPFRVRYKDEPGQDSGGVYRDFLDTIAEELMSPQLPLLVPSPNHAADVGEHRDCFLVSPSLDVSSGSPGRRMLHFLGQLMGVCLRRGDVLPLCLSQAVWKGLLGEELTLEDLESFDLAATEGVRQLRQISDPEVFRSLGEFNFVTRDSSGQERQLVENGRKMLVDFSQVALFARLSMEARCTEAKRQLEVLRAGLASLVPLECLALWTWQYLEERICGIAVVDVVLLRKYARYDGISPEAREVEFLWSVLEAMSQSDLRHFLRFVWGRSRLPPDGSPKWAEGFKITHQAYTSDTDSRLPTAHTCFFQLDLPAYSRLEICNERIMFAIHNCVSLGIA